jgi:hypothetical protein
LKFNKEKIVSYLPKISVVIISIFVIAFFVAVIELITSSVEESEKLENYETVETVYIQSINFETDISGYKRFLIGSGKIQEKNYYYVYLLQSDGGIKLTKYNADNTVIYQTVKENERSYAEITRDRLDKITEVKLYVPENSIIENYDFEIN